MRRNTQVKWKGSRRRKELIFLACLFVLPVIHTAIFYFGGNIQSFTLAFQSYDSAKAEFYFIGFNNFKLVFEDIANSPLIRTGMLNTLYLYLMETFLSMPISLLCAYFVLKKVPGSGALKIIFFLPSMISSVVMVLMYKYFCEYAVPYIAKKMFNADSFPLILNEYPYAFPMLIGYSLWTGFAGGIVLYLGTMSRASDGVLDAAKIDGVGMFGEFWHVILPTVYPLVSVFLFTGFVSIFTGGGPVYTFYKDSAPTYTYTTGYYLFVKVMGQNATYSDYPYTAAVGLIITVVATPLTFLLKYVLEHVGPTED